MRDHRPLDPASVRDLHSVIDRERVAGGIGALQAAARRIEADALFDDENGRVLAFLEEMAATIREDAR